VLFLNIFFSFQCKRSCGKSVLGVCRLSQRENRHYRYTERSDNGSSPSVVGGSSHHPRRKGRLLSMRNNHTTWRCPDTHQRSNETRSLIFILNCWNLLILIIASSRELSLRLSEQRRLLDSLTTLHIFFIAIQALVRRPTP